MINPLTRFADVINLSTSRTADPASAGIDRFVGLEHIEPENLHISRWGLVADGTTFTNTIKGRQVFSDKPHAYRYKIMGTRFSTIVLAVFILLGFLTGCGSEDWEGATTLPGRPTENLTQEAQPTATSIWDGAAGLPGISTPTLINSNSENTTIRFEQTTEEIKEFPPIIFPINNCGGVADVKQEITQNYIHEIIDETKIKFGVEIPVLAWLKIVAEIENRYGTSDKETTTYSTTLTVPAGQNIQYTVIRKQTWESGIAIVNSDGVETSGAYRILKNETFEVANSEQKSCP